MITYDDLLAARFLDQKFPQLRGPLERALEQLDRNNSSASLLSYLVVQGLIKRNLAERVYRQLGQYNRRRALSIFVELLRGDGLGDDEIKQNLNAAGKNADAASLSEHLLSNKRIDPERARNLQYRARVALDRHRAARVEEYRSRATRGNRRTTIASNLSRAGAQKADSANAIIKQTLIEADSGLRAPDFAIPDWIDAADRFTGKELCGYRFLGKIGSGNMGTVYLCDHRERPGPIALKVLLKNANSEAKDRFKREVFIQSMLPPDKRIIELYDGGRTDSGYHYLAMEFFDSTDLEKILKVEGRLELERAISITAQMADALANAHAAGVIHRDIKPANILVANQGDLAKLADFGIALSIEMGELENYVFKSMDGTITGTPEYVSPEQAMGGPIDGRSDLYSLGVVFYLMISGRLPFDSENKMGFITCHMVEDPIPLRKSCPDRQLPDSLVALVDRLLEKEPEDRFQDGRELCDALLAIAEELRGLNDSMSGESSTIWNHLGVNRA